MIFLLSGGGSSLLALPAEGISLADKQAINKALLRSGAHIGEMNCVRKHLSAIRAAARPEPAGRPACTPTRSPTCPATRPRSPPATVADPTTSAEALAILERYHIEVPANVRAARGSRSETLKPGDPMLSRSHFQLIATPQQSLDAAAQAARDAGITH